MNRVRPHARPSLVVARLLPVLLLLLAGACTETTRVRGLVADADAAVLRARADAPLEADHEHATIEAIDAWIAAHPDQPTTAAALRLRQGLLHLVAGRPATALAVLETVDAARLGERDRALLAAREPIAWWQSVAPAATGLPGRAAFDARLSTLDEVLAGTDPASEVHAHLAALRALMAGKAAMAHAETDAALAAALRDALETYAASLDPADRDALERIAVPAGDPGASVVAADRARLRAAVQAVAVARAYRRFAQAAGLTGMDWGGADWLVRASD